MRCPSCAKQNRRSRTGMRCPGCGYRFVLDPKKDPIADGTLRKLIGRLSAGGTWCFTRDQLAIEICRVLAARKLSVEGGIGELFVLVLVAVAAHALLPAWIANVVLAVLALGVVGFVWDRRRRVRSEGVEIRSDLARARDIVDRYHRKHPLPELATGDAYDGSDGRLDDAPPYSPERIVVVERRELVDMLVRNQLAQRARAVVVSVDGYPEHVMQACGRFLERDPSLEVALLHDASREGFTLGERLREHPVLGPHAGRAVDLGWSRETVLAQRGRLPWIEEGSLAFSAAHRERLDAGQALPVDFAPPRGMPAVLTGALVSGLALTALHGDVLAFEFEAGSDDFG